MSNMYNRLYNQHLFGNEVELLTKLFNRPVVTNNSAYFDYNTLSTSDGGYDYIIMRDNQPKYCVDIKNSHWTGNNKCFIIEIEEGLDGRDNRPGWINSPTHINNVPKLIMQYHKDGGFIITSLSELRRFIDDNKDNEYIYLMQSKASTLWMVPFGVMCEHLTCITGKFVNNEIKFNKYINY